MAKATTYSAIRKLIENLALTISVGDGLHLKRLPSASYSWRYNYTHAGKQKTVAYGTFPQVSLAEARARHKDTLRQRFELKDPMAERAAVRKAAKVPQAESFATVAREWLTKQSVIWTHKHFLSVQGAMERHIFPRIGALPLTAIDAADVLGSLKALDETGRGETAHRCHQRIAAVFTYGIATQRCRTNPADGIRGALTPVVHTQMNAIDPNELPELISRIDGYNGDAVTRLGLRFMLLTFVRTSEMIHAQWHEFDLEIKEWNVPGQRMKRRLDHIVPLSRQAIALLDELREINGQSAFVFRSPRHDKPISSNTLLFGLYRLGYHSRMTGHGFRAVASTILNEMQVNPDIIERQLAHVPENEVRGAYNRAKWIDQRHTMMQQWADHVDAIQGGGKVIPLRKAS